MVSVDPNEEGDWMVPSLSCADWSGQPGGVGVPRKSQESWFHPSCDTSFRLPLSGFLHRLGAAQGQGCRLLRPWISGAPWEPSCAAAASVGFL